MQDTKAPLDQALRFQPLTLSTAVQSVRRIRHAPAVPIQGKGRSILATCSSSLLETQHAILNSTMPASTMAIHILSLTSPMEVAADNSTYHGMVRNSAPMLYTHSSLPSLLVSFIFENVMSSCCCSVTCASRSARSSASFVLPTTHCHLGFSSQQRNVSHPAGYSNDARTAIFTVRSANICACTTQCQFPGPPTIHVRRFEAATTRQTSSTIFTATGQAGAIIDTTAAQRIASTTTSGQGAGAA